MKRSLFWLMLWGGLQAAASSPAYIALADSADNYIGCARWDDAQRVIKDALRMEPGNFSNSLLLSNLGVVQTRKGEYEEALESFRLGLSIAPRSSAIRNNRARTLIEIGRYSEAIDDLNASLANDSLQEWPLQMRGRLLLFENPEKAKADFMRLARHYPRNPSAMSGLAAVAETEGNTAEALRYYDESLRMEDDVDIWFSKILLEVNSGKFSEASSDLKRAMNIYPDNGDLYLLRALLNKNCFRNKDAAEDKKTAISKGADKQLVEQLLPGM